jgi:hypothetical protein
VELDSRFNPELRFAIGMLDMHMWPAFLAKRSRTETLERARPSDHPYRIADAVRVVQRRERSGC